MHIRNRTNSTISKYYTVYDNDGGMTKPGQLQLTVTGKVWSFG
jgi:hypothetical protein